MEEPLNTKGFHAAVLLLNLHQFCRTEPDHRAAGGGGAGAEGEGEEIRLQSSADLWTSLPVQSEARSEPGEHHRTTWTGSELVT